MKFSSPVSGIAFGMLQRITPFVIALLLAVLAYIPGVVPGLSALMPPLPFMALFYFSIHRPDWFGVTSSFVLGLLVDLLIGAPLGVTAGLYAVTHLLLRRQQRYFRGSPFTTLWIGYGVAQLALTLAQAITWWVLAGVTPHGLMLLGINIVGTAVFPVLAMVLARLHKWLAV